LKKREGHEARRMFIPLHDGAPLRHITAPYACWALIAVNIGLWAAGALGLLGDLEKLDTSLGLIPATVFGYGRLTPDLQLVPVWATFLTSPFLHGGLFHLLGNMAFLWVFGDNVEDALGTARFLIFYILCGLASGAVYALSAPQAEAPLIGASGAVSGVIAAYLLLHPNVRVFGLVFNIVPVRLSAMWLLGAWILMQLGSALFSVRGDVGWWAHVGGAAAGLVLTPLLRQPYVRLGWTRGRPNEEG
jgi:membrane associated rhomboid family serine protease